MMIFSFAYNLWQDTGTLYLPSSRPLARSILVDPVLIHSVIDPSLFGWHFLFIWLAFPLFQELLMNHFDW